MYNAKKKQQVLLANVLLAAGILSLAFLVKGTTHETKSLGAMTIAVAILFRFQCTTRNKNRSQLRFSQVQK